MALTRFARSLSPRKLWKFIIIFSLISLLCFILYSERMFEFASVEKYAIKQPISTLSSNVCFESVQQSLESPLSSASKTCQVQAKEALCQYKTQYEYFNIPIYCHSEKNLSFPANFSKSTVDCIYTCRHSVALYAMYIPNKESCQCLWSHADTFSLDANLRQFLHSTLVNYNFTKLSSIYNIMDFDEVNKSPWAESTHLRIAFLLVIHGRDWAQIVRLLRLIYHHRHFYLIHVDQRSEFLYQKLHRILNPHQFPNVLFMHQRRATIWGGASLLQMLLDAMLVTAEHFGAQPWHYFINLSESDLAIKPLHMLEDFLAANMGRNFVKSHGHNTSAFIKQQALREFFVECEFHLWRVSSRQLPGNLLLDGGSDWVVLHVDLVRLLLDPTPSPLVLALKSYFQHALLPAETFFHTTLRNSHLCGTMVDLNLRLTNWKRPLGCQCEAYERVVDWCGCSPNVLRFPMDLERVENVAWKPIFFVRKLDPVVAPMMVSHLLAQIPSSSTELDNVTLPPPGVVTLFQEELDGALKPQSNVLHLGLLALRYLLHEEWKRHDRSLCEYRRVEDPLQLEIRSVDLQFQWLHSQPGSEEVEDSWQFYKNKAESVLMDLGQVKMWFQRQVIVNYTAVRQGEWRLLDVRVGDGFDAKELLFRNYPGFLSIGSFGVTVLHSWEPPSEATSSLHIVFQFVSPEGNEISSPVQELHSTRPQEAWTEVHPHLKRIFYTRIVWQEMGLVPGSGRWTLKVVGLDKRIWAETNFVLLPTGGQQQQDWQNSWVSTAAHWLIREWRVLACY